MQPLVTVNILSYNRKEDLRTTLTKVYEQDYRNIEVIVVDNNSTDGTREMVRQEFPFVQLIELDKNIGIAGWNEGFKAAKGEYVLVLDDDSYPEKQTIALGLGLFEENTKLGIVSYRIFNTRIQKCETEDFLAHPYFFNGCGALINKEVLKTIGYYNEKYFLYYHELDYSARCYNAGFDIQYFPNATVVHAQSLQSRGEKNEDPFRSEYRYYYYYLSYSIFLMQNFPLKYSIKYLLKYVINRFIICFTYGYYRSFVRATWYCLKNFSSLRVSGVRLKPEIQKFYRNGNIAFIDRSYFPSFK